MADEKAEHRRSPQRCDTPPVGLHGWAKIPAPDHRYTHRLSQRRGQRQHANQQDTARSEWHAITRPAKYPSCFYSTLHRRRKMVGDLWRSAAARADSNSTQAEL